jgi:hypothetical protein
VAAELVVHAGKRHGRHHLASHAAPRPKPLRLTHQLARATAEIDARVPVEG